MSKRYTSRYNGSMALDGHRDYVSHAIEKEPTAYSTRPARRDRLNESRFNNTTMLCCNEQRCVCTCPDCKEPNIAGRGKRCDVCELVHERQVAREQSESFNRVDDLLTQLRMIGAL
jgi:hypothetical protein